MVRRALLTTLVFGITANSVLADFSYEQSTKVTGGAMAGMMKVAGAFSKKARQPMAVKVAIKGDRMASISEDSVHIVDLNSETMTDVNLKDRTYAVITFADMARAMEQMAAKMKQSPEASIDFKFDVKETGATRQISGMNAKETVLTITAEGTDAKSGAKGGTKITTALWLADNMPGYEEVRNFYARMAQKIAWAPGSSGFLSAIAGQQPGISKGFSEMYKQASKLEGVPVLQITRIGVSGEGVPTEADAAAAQQEAAAQEQQPAPPTASEATETAAAGAATKKMGRFGSIAGGLGGFGGFGRRKKKEEQRQAAQESAPTPQPAAASAAPPGTLMELTSELTGFSSSPVDASQFEVPAGFKQVEHGMQKALK